ncbi:hypothetical protein T492DRAFT_855058 [Pavlovales sp. CCMP2436]|nr:hypothetical protein T492DRAFT_855058 [Pavlovales sp. CCMP2436]
MMRVDWAPARAMTRVDDPGPPALAAKLESYVRNAHEVRVRTTEALALFAAEVYYRGEDPGEYLTETFVAALANVISEPKGEFAFAGWHGMVDWVNEHYMPLKSGDPLDLYVVNNANMRNYLARSILTAYKTNAAKHIDKHLRRFVELWAYGGDYAVLRERFPEAAERGKVKRLIGTTTHALMMRDAAFDYAQLDVRLPDCSTFRDTLTGATINAYANEHVLPKCPLSKNHYAHSASHGTQYIKGMMHADMLAGKYGARALVVCPKTTSNIPGHVPIDSSAVASHFMSDAAVASVQVWCEKKKAMRGVSRSELSTRTTEHADAIWGAFLRTEKKVFSPSRVTGAQPRKRFDYFCSTDGVSISLNMTERTFDGVTASLAAAADGRVSLGLRPLEFRPKKGWKPPCASVKVARGPKASGEAYITDEDFVQATPKNTRLITVDPNARDLIYALEANVLDPKKPNTLRYTSMQRRFESGEKAARIERERLGKAHHFSEENIDMATVSHRTTDTEALSRYIQVASLARATTRAAYSLKTWRELRSRAYSGTQRTEAKLVQAFESKFGPPETSTVAWGNWSKPPGMRGLGPVPGKRLRDVLRARGYRVALLDEFGTSTTCFGCKAPCKSVSPFRTCPNPKPHMRTKNPIVLCHGLIQCELCSCAAFNRDVHACLNMHLIARAALDGAQRPAHLDRARGGAAPSSKAKPTRKRKAAA